jgi:hypothetical protein
VIIAVSRGRTLEATGPQEACSTDRNPFVDRCHPSVTDQRSEHGKTLMLQRLEIAALEARQPRPEQVADRQLQEVGL